VSSDVLGKEAYKNGGENINGSVSPPAFSYIRLISGYVDPQIFSCKTETRTFSSLHELRGGLRECRNDHRQSDRRVARYISSGGPFGKFSEHLGVRAAVRGCANIKRNRIGRDRYSIFMPPRIGAVNIRGNLRQIDHILTVCIAQSYDRRISGTLGDLHDIHRILRQIEGDLDLLLETSPCNADGDLGTQDVGAKNRDACLKR